ncbi:MAG TPA: sigma-70 family RNA polymerase sigma factor [Chloroflexota bacterium]|jgi:RNA polymerase sigma-70 factor (ECF subfamily)
MIEAPESVEVAAALAGDHSAFERLTTRYRRELLVHCYRILGSFEDAEDVLQETLLLAWRRLASFEGRAPLRAWLYKIANNTALNAQAGLRRRSLPTATHAAADPHAPLLAPNHEILWLEPLPDALLTASSASPEAIYDLHESVTLAFLAALQHLPGRQRAALILRDVLGWKATEVAELLDMSVIAVNSALQRARETMKARRPAIVTGAIAPATDERTATLLARYVQAWEATDTPLLATLLRDDAVLTMPPVPSWYRGRAAIGEFFATQFAGQARGSYRLAPTKANGGPAFGLYKQDPAGVYQPMALQVLSITGDQIAEIHAFQAIDDRLFTRFSLPLAR